MSLSRSWYEVGFMSAFYLTWQNGVMCQPLRAVKLTYVWLNMFWMYQTAGP